MMNARHLDDDGEDAQVIRLDTGHQQDDGSDSDAERSPLERGIASGLSFLRS